ncbi:hypothetical protein PIB30_031041 [Stylosanthes scabra]|uniref:F-box domain-containing protein n=1 Tax=Stylosanthes scabra TaxID=79078 RepID=A0ABU6QC79_9FABA|nr:hypothetical protein [Stylosanthes scabra]
MAAKQTDIISSLPDSILLYILTSLPFKEAAKTCILSKKWLNMWQFPNTVVNNKLEFTKDEDYEAIEAEQRKAFKNFIKNWITFHKHHHLHDKFALKVSPPSNCGDVVGACIDFLVEEGVKDLELDFAKPQWVNEEEDPEEEDPEQNNESALVEFPSRVYEHKKLHQKLEILQLHACSFAPESFAKFEALKDVTLAWMPLRTEMVRTLLSMCKWMESLTLKRCWDLEDLDLGKLELKKLAIDNCSLEVDDICFEAPNLKAFKYRGLVGVSDVSVKAGTIEEADLGFRTLVFECGNELQKFLYDFSAVNVLTVCSVLLQGYEDPYYNEDPERFWERVIVPLCLRKSLREVEVNGFMGTRNQILACYYFIRAAVKLNKLTINVLNEENDDPAMVHMRHLSASQLLRAQRASKNLVSKMAKSRSNDMISSLPDSLLFFILSSLSFKEAARTCLLSKCWLAMCRSPNIKNTHFQIPSASAASCGEGAVFINFISNWIIEHKNLMEEKFSLIVAPPPNCGDVIGTCMDFAIFNTAVKDLELDFHKPQWNNDDDENENENHDDVMVELPKRFYNQINLQLKLQSLKLQIRAS